MLLQVSFFCFERRDLRLQLIILVLLIEIGILHVLLCLEHLTGQVFSDVLGLARQVVVQRLLLRPQRFYLLFVEIKLLLQCFDCFLKTVNLALERGSEGARRHRVVGLADALE